MLVCIIVRTGIKNSELESKAEALKATAGTQSESELASTNLTDLNTNGNNQPQAKLATKAEALKEKAGALHDAAEAIVQAAKAGPLKDLSSLAEKLKKAANTSGTGSGLHSAAEELAAQKSAAATEQANKVIKAFETVEKNYGELMKLAKERGLTNDPMVTAVVKAYHTLKTTYYQMLIPYRIQQKAKEFHGAAEALQSDASLPDAEGPLKALNSVASAEMGNLETKAQKLKTIDLGAKDPDIVTKYLLVAEAYKALMDKAKEQNAENVTEVQAVTKAFETLQNSYENVLRLRVQELATLAQKLKDVATGLSGASTLGLTAQANALKDAASSTDGLKEKATELVEAINTGTDTTAPATDVIEQFEDVRTAYSELSGQQTYSEKLKSALAKIKQGTKLGSDEQKVTAVDTAYIDLKSLYDKILNVTKIKHYAEQVYTKAPQLASDGDATPSEVKAIIGKLKSVYNDLGNSNPGDQATVKNDFESTKNAFYGAQLGKNTSRIVQYFGLG